MSIFHVKNISEKPPSYTHDPNVKDIDYQTIKNQVRSSIIDKYSSFEKLGRQSASKASVKESPSKHHSIAKTLVYITQNKKQDMMFGKHTQQEVSSQSSPAKFNGLKKKMSSIGAFEEHNFNLSQGSAFKHQYYDKSFLPQENNKLSRSGSMAVKQRDESKLSGAIPISRLVEIQNLLELAPHNELNSLPRNYVDELQRVAASITRNLRNNINI